MDALERRAIVTRMDKRRDIAKAVIEFMGEAIAETLWPTRCALCDCPGDVLCEHCLRQLPFLDQWRACKRCGAPYGLVQCTECNPVKLAHLERDTLPFAWCASATMFDHSSTGRLVRVYKDQGEQRLAEIMARLMVQALTPSWSFEAVSFVPATLAAYRHRGYDHAQLLAQHIACLVGLPVIPLLARPTTSDQRALGRSQRVANLQGRFCALDAVQAPQRLLLVDDVFTTGATLCAATDALLSCGVKTVGCLTFARV